MTDAIILLNRPTGTRTEDFAVYRGSGAEGSKGEVKIIGKHCARTDKKEAYNLLYISVDFTIAKMIKLS